MNDTFLVSPVKLRVFQKPDGEARDQLVVLNSVEESSRVPLARVRFSPTLKILPL